MYGVCFMCDFCCLVCFLRLIGCLFYSREWFLCCFFLSVGFCCLSWFRNCVMLDWYGMVGFFVLGGV